MVKERIRMKKIKIPVDYIFDYREPATLRRFLTERGKILGRRMTGISAKHQRALTIAVKRARILGLVSFTSTHDLKAPL